jgi:hypothetical protein
VGVEEDTWRKNILDLGTAGAKVLRKEHVCHDCVQPGGECGWSGGKRGEQKFLHTHTEHVTDMV